MHPELMADTKLGSNGEQLVEARSAEIRPDARAKAHELIGSRLREARLRSGLGVRELSRQLEISASSISQIELGRVVPSVGTLYALTNALSISMDSLFVAEGDGAAGDGADGDGADGDGADGDGADGHGADGHGADGDTGAEPAAPPVEVPPSEAPARAVGSGPRPAAGAHEGPFVLRRSSRRVIDLERGVRWELLTPVPEPGAEFLEVHYPAGSDSSANGQAIRHNGRDYCLVLEGSLRAQIGFEEYVLNSGDSLAFDATIPHRFWNAGEVSVRAVWFVLDRWLPHGGGSTEWSGDAGGRSTTAPD
jgi:DNA-binding XRE family transcriptional regulator/mannose-6-phosphate isomerase-like protein (cupin superfamily)